MDQARELLVDCVELFLAEINSNEKMRPYLFNQPFSVEDIGITIFIHDEKGKKLFDPYISVVSLDWGKVSFRTNDPDKEYTYKLRVSES